MKLLIVAALALSFCTGIAGAKERAKDQDGDRTKDRACTLADVARFEAMLGGIRKGEYRTDPRFAVSIHYLGTSIVGGTCNVALRPAG
jgi:hypothetical protein